VKNLNRFEKEKARFSAATQERAAEPKNAREAFSTSCSDYTFATGKKQSLLDYLPHEPERAVTAVQLGNMLHISSREVTKLIQKYRLAGVPICAACGDQPGYYIATEPEMLGKYIKSLDGRLREVRRTREALTETLESMTGQQRLDGY